jgi:transcriptional regulator with XRE-family HTH domain
MKPGERIRELRKNLGLSQKTFAKKMEYSQGFLAEIEVGKKQPSRAFLKKLAEVFETSIDYVLYGDTLDQMRSLFSPLKEKIERLKRGGAVPAKSFSDDEVAILKLLRELSFNDSVVLLRQILAKIEADPLVIKDDYLLQNVKRVETIVKKGSWESGLDFDGMLWGMEMLEKRKEKDAT